MNMYRGRLWFTYTAAIDFGLTALSAQMKYILPLVSMLQVKN